MPQPPSPGHLKWKEVSITAGKGVGAIFYSKEAIGTGITTPQRQKASVGPGLSDGPDSRESGPSLRPGPTDAFCLWGVVIPVPIASFE